MTVSTIDDGRVPIVRYVAAPPTRSAEAALGVFVRFVGRLLEGLEFSRAQEVEGALNALSPLLRFVIVTHAAEHRPIEVATPAVLLAISFTYTYPAVEDLSLPAMAAYGTLADDAVIEVRVPFAARWISAMPTDFPRQLDLLSCARIVLVPDADADAQVMPEGACVGDTAAQSTPSTGAMSETPTSPVPMTIEPEGGSR